MMLGLPEATKARYDVSRVDKLMISSAPARRETKLAIMEFFRNGKLHELYGSTETGWVTLAASRRADRPARLGGPRMGRLGADPAARCARP